VSPNCLTIPDTHPSRRTLAKPITSSAQQHPETTRVRLVRETLVFSKPLAHHIGAITYFICHDNLEKVGALPV